MISDKYITKSTSYDLEILNADSLYNTNKAYMKHNSINKSPLFVPEVTKTMGYFLQDKSVSAYTPILTRIREDNTITQRIVLGKISEFDLTKFNEAFNKRKPVIGLTASINVNRLHLAPTLDIIYDKGQLIMLYNDKRDNIFSEIITDKTQYNEIKSKLWSFASICATDVKHTNIAYESDGRINIEVKVSNINTNELSVVPSNEKNIYNYQDISIRVTPHRLVYNYK